MKNEKTQPTNQATYGHLVIFRYSIALSSTNFSRGSSLEAATWVEGETLDCRGDFVIQAESANGPGIPPETWDNRWREGEGKKT